LFFSVGLGVDNVGLTLASKVLFSVDQFQVFQPVIRADSVLVVNVFPGLERAA
jgi:hypothetical protein